MKTKPKQGKGEEAVERRESRGKVGRVDTPYRVYALPSLLKCNCEIVIVACQHLIKSSRHTEGCPRHLRQRSDSFSLSLSLPVSLSPFPSAPSLPVAFRLGVMSKQCNLSRTFRVTKASKRNPIQTPTSIRLCSDCPQVAAAGIPHPSPQLVLLL